MFNCAGCVREGRDLEARIELVVRQFDEQFSQVVQRYFTDERLLDADRGWATCITGKGFSYVDLNAAMADVALRFENEGGTPDVKRFELLLATADLDCGVKRAAVA